MKCKYCEQPATRIMPQSIDEGVTVDQVVTCAAHASGWWDGADWNGRDQERELTDMPNVIMFHDRGVGRELRHFVDGKVLPKLPADNEMLYPELCAEVENKVKSGDYSGVTADACYPNWTLLHIAARA
jgi:hypothetical protein